MNLILNFDLYEVVYNSVKRQFMAAKFHRYKVLDYKKSFKVKLPTVNSKLEPSVSGAPYEQNSFLKYKLYIPTFNIWLGIKLGTWRWEARERL